MGPPQTAAPTTGRYRLRPAAAPTTVDPGPDQRRVIGNTLRRLRVSAGPGTGKTSTIVEAVAERVEKRGVDPSSILVLTFSRRAAAELTDRLLARLGMTLGEPMVRTLHSYAYSLLRADAARDGAPAPRMLGAAESDRMVADLLAGHLEAGAEGWPVDLRPALSSRAFAAELRDLVLRTGERAIPPSRIADLGRRHRRPAWVAAARLAREYQQVVDLRMGTTGLGAALDQAELTLAALQLLDRDEVLALEQARIRRVFVDEYQDVDPAQAALVERLAAGADELVVVGDADQAIYAFRGADPGAVRRIDVDATVSLTVCRRSGPALVAATRRIVELLPGPADHRRLTATADDDPAPLEIRTLPTPAREAAFVADRLRRAHLDDDIAWSDMAVIVRSPAASLPALRRAFTVAGVPCTVAADDRGPLDDPLAAALVTVLECGLDPERLDGELAHALLTSAIVPGGGLDALALRRLRSAVRITARRTDTSTAELLALLLSDLAAGRPTRLLDGVPDDVAGAVRRLAGLLAVAAGRGTVPDGEAALWEVWAATGLQGDLLATVERGGRAGQRADTALDAVVALFHDAAELAARIPGAGVRAFVDQARGQRLPGDSAGGRGRGGAAVTLLSAHAAKGLEWEVVAVCGVEEGRWPDLRVRSGLLATDDLLDIAGGTDPSLSRVPGLLADERRLFYVACTRARRRLIVTAVSGTDRAPSRFLAELAGDRPIAAGWPQQDGRPQRALQLADLVGELRRVVGSTQADPDAAAEAARQLARLATAGVRGAHPDQWWGLAGPSTDAPAVPADGTVTVSPSTVEAVQTCALRGVLERRGARGPVGDPQMMGMVVHAAAYGLSLGVPRADVAAEVDEFLAGQEQLPDWQVRRLRRAITAMTDAAAGWLEQTRAAGWETIGAELAVDLPLGAPEDPESPVRAVRMTGRVDLLSRRPDGAVVISDFKTGSKQATRKETAEHLQLAAYQVALAAGAVADVAGTGGGGAQLIHLRSGVAKVVGQEPLGEQDAARTMGTIRDSALRLVAATLPAQENQRCERCPVRSCCPLQSEGRQATR